MVATELTRDGREGSPGMTLLAAGVCGLVAWRTGRIGPTILSGIASVWLGRLVWGA